MKILQKLLWLYLMNTKTMLVFAIILVTLMSSSCIANNANEKTPNDYSAEVIPAFDATAAAPTEASSEIIPYDYSSFTDEWFCAETATYVTLEIDQNCNVTGFVMSVVGNHVPSSRISGVITDNAFISRLYCGDEYSEEGDEGSLVLSFVDQETLKGTVTLTKPGLELAEGDMTFERFNPGKPNPYFFDDSVTEQTYTVKIVTDEITETDVVMHITKIAELSESVVYEFRLEDIAGFPVDRLTLGYFDVDAYSIWKADPTENNLEQIILKGTSASVGHVVCLRKDLEDTLSPDEQGWHHYVTVNGDIIESHSYDNQVESGYYETFIWEKGRGLIYYASGYGSERDSIELTIKD